MYWTMITISALIHIAFVAFLMKLWQDRHIFSQGYLDDLENRADAYANEQSWK